MRTRGKTSGKGLEATEPRRRKRRIPRPEVPHFTLESSALSVRNIGTFCRKHRNFPSAFSARFISSVRNCHLQRPQLSSATSGCLMKDFATLRIEPPHIAFSTSVSLSFSPGFSPSLFRSPSPEFGVIPSSSPERATPSFPRKPHLVPKHRPTFSQECRAILRRQPPASPGKHPRFPNEPILEGRYLYLLFFAKNQFPL